MGGIWSGKGFREWIAYLSLPRTAQDGRRQPFRAACAKPSQARPFFPRNLFL